MQTIRWIRLVLSTIFILLGLTFGTYFYIKEHSPAIAHNECADNFLPDASDKVIPFGNFRCPE